VKINKISLFNFGSYEGLNSFSFHNTDPNKRVVVIGGKNGAGKTTLFTALQICLYGHYAFGFRSTGRHYLREVYNLVNNKVRLDDSASAYVEISFDQITDTERVFFRVRRSWSWDTGEIVEAVSVWQDEKALDEEALGNFQKYLIHLIPPDLLKLYFFDGEKVADYFLGNREVNVRDALMVLSGNDTFDILFDNVKRVLKLSESQGNDSAKNYLENKQIADGLLKSINDTQGKIDELISNLEDLQSAASLLTQQYTARGGVTLDEWTSLHNELKEEEEKRERINWQRKALATDVLPFIIAGKLLNKIPEQISSERSFLAYLNLLEQIEDPAFSAMLATAAAELGTTDPHGAGQQLLLNIRDHFYDERWEEFTPLFGLSNDEEAQVHATIAKVNSVEAVVFKKYQHRIETSLEKTKAIRAKIQSSDIEHFEDYVREITRLEEEQKVVQLKISHEQEKLEQLKLEHVAVESQLRNAKKAFEEQLKKESVSAVSGRVLLLLEDLQRELYTHLIRKVEKDINHKFRQLIRKKDFFTEIRIDDDFNIHVLRQQTISKTDILTQLKGNSFNALQKAIGKYAVEELLGITGTMDVTSLREHVRQNERENYLLLIEIDKDHLSSGEKQIFVMSLYWSMMQQSKNDLPYVIDTPFARIDTEHRANITDFFFKQLNGQLIVLSTDEEISDAHIASMKDQIAHIYMLEYGQDKSTHIHNDVYFEV